MADHDEGVKRPVELSIPVPYHLRKDGKNLKNKL